MASRIGQELRDRGVRLYAPAPPQELAAFEAALECELPSALRALYEDHMGVVGDPDLALGLLTPYEAVEATKRMRGDPVGWLLDRDVACFWGDSNGNWAGMWLRGPLAGLVCLLPQDDAIALPTHVDIDSLYAAVLANHDEQRALGETYFDLDELVCDYPRNVEHPGPARPEDPALVTELLAMADRADESMQVLRSLQAVRLASEEHVEVLLSMVGGSADFLVEIAALYALGDLCCERAVPDLERLAMDETAQDNRRAVAASALRRIGTDEAIHALRGLREVLDPAWFGPNFWP